MAIGDAVSRNPKKRKNSFLSNVGKMLKSSFPFRSNRKKETKKGHNDESLKREIDAQHQEQGHNDENLREKIAAQNCQEFSFQNLCRATNQFDPQNLLGEGGYGRVFKGNLEDGRAIAVKKLSKTSDQGWKEFTSEAELLSGVKHPNVVKLIGYCAENNECLLVYELVENKSLDKLLSSPNGREQLNWTRRFIIIESTAGAVCHLHNDHHLIHRDIKASNVLVDRQWAPKLADFGLGRLLPEDQTSDYTHNRSGTKGYMAPEYCFHGKLSKRTDTYSFGVFMLEVITGRQSLYRPEDKNLLVWAFELFNEGRISEVLDAALANSPDIEQVANCIYIGLLCVQYDPTLRPSMKEVVIMLAQKEGYVKKKIGIPGTYFFEVSGRNSQNQGDQPKAQVPIGEKIVDDMPVDEYQSQHSLSNLSEIKEEGQLNNSSTFPVQDDSASGEATKNQGVEFEAEVSLGAEIPEIIPFDVDQSQHSPFNSNEIMKDDPHSNSSAFPAQDESVGTNMPTVRNDLPSSLEPSAGEERRIPGTSSSEATTDQPHEKLPLPEMKESGAEEPLGVVKEYPEINAEPKEKRRLIGELMAVKKELGEVRRELDKERENDTITCGPFRPSRLLQLCGRHLKLMCRLISCKSAIERYEKGKKIFERTGLQDAISAVQGTPYLAANLPYWRKRIQELDMNVGDCFEPVDEQIRDTPIRSAEHQSWYWSIGSRALHEYEERKKKKNQKQEKEESGFYGFYYRHQESGKQNTPIDNVTYLWDVMDKFDKEMSLSNEQLKALAQKYEKGKMPLPSFLAHFSESDKVLLCKDSTKFHVGSSSQNCSVGKVELDKETFYLEAQQYMRETLKDIDTGIGCLKRYISAFIKWNKGLEILDVGDLTGAMTQAQGPQQSCSQQLCAQQFLGDNRFFKSEVTH